ncbi:MULTISPECIES: hypothetical protein [unclassified Bradyrhizobium]|uniref:hypothetical protein n=1 Tax=unclassified Bradyrhizobium TaxID=2631580 RepID=UPI0015C8BB83|nr:MULTISPECIES: hypothetical protein [unclassified Bradyrhizobium]MBB4256036.1 hypothetical protein [Bradyrhizobium sp. CIR3A]MBB4392457.1 hypothetical protein [Bradyrhizobium sp. ERR14]NYG48204.1 hypothetical protein [Bradyrhizobium sp. IAR9]
MSIADAEFAPAEIALKPQLPPGVVPNASVASERANENRAEFAGAARAACPLPLSPLNKSALLSVGSDP